MKPLLSLMLLALALILTSCSTPPPVVFHSKDSNALLIQSDDSQTCQILQPSVSSPADNTQIMSVVKTLPHRETAIVMLENYQESRLDEEFWKRGTPLFIALREQGYQHVVFLRGQNVTNPDGLVLLVEYF